MTKEEFLRRIYGVDTKAGHIIKAIITKAEACPDYARRIYYTGEAICHNYQASQILLRLFSWYATLDGIDISPSNHNELFYKTYDLLEDSKR